RGRPGVRNRRLFRPQPRAAAAGPRRPARGIQRRRLRDGDEFELQQPTAGRGSPGGRRNAPVNPPPGNLRRPGADGTRSQLSVRAWSAERFLSARRSHAPRSHVTEAGTVIRNLSRVALAVAVAAFAGLAARAQDPRIEPPRTPAEFWNAVEFELNTGKFDVAAQYLKAFLAANPTEQDYLAIEKERGMAAVLRLRTVIQWSTDKPTDDEARKTAAPVIERATAALRKQVGDVARINRFIGNLRASPEERAYAIRELQRSGALAMPHLIAAMVADPDPAQRALLLDILPLLPQDTIAPLLAATDMRDPVLKVQLLNSLAARQERATLGTRAETDPLPTLDFLAASPRESDQVRRKARDTAALLRATSPARLPIAKVALTQAAEQFYQHKANFINPQSVSIWRWE